MTLTLLRTGGVIAIDNTLQRGRVIDTECNSEAVISVRNLNDKLKDDERIDLSFLSVGDGLTLCFKKK
ncbi:O-methyltransferase MdmC [Armadillidium vulgare]|nr:O-methyltransferase MdmC [Armadillidium vulgare]